MRRRRHEMHQGACLFLTGAVMLAALAAVCALSRADPRGRALPVSAPGAQGLSRDAVPGAGPSGWIGIDYGGLVDRRRLTHSGESVGMILQALAGRPVPVPGPGGSSEDVTAHVLLDPLVEPYAFVLSDALDTLAAPAPATPLVEVGALWQPGEAQPAWAELLRARHFVVESDGTGRFRVCLPWTWTGATIGAAGTAGGTAAAPDGSVLPSVDSEQAARQAWDAAWPVLRHVLAAERRRLAKKDGNRPEDHPISVDARAYVHFPARSLFQLGLRPYRVTVTDTRADGRRPAVDLQAWQGFLERGLQLEGGRLEESGAVRLLGSDAPARPTLLGRPLTLADMAVAYRAVFHGGLGEPYMSLDRGDSPQTSSVNYGGRLRDTALGLVSLLCDIRFKTFSLGIDVLAGQDLRDRVRRELPGFRTHLERFSSDARSKGVLTQQTRLWFYPDAVDLTLSSEGDVLVMRRVRMSAASERVQQETFTAGTREPDPPWTAETVSAINKDYDALLRFFPELGDLDQVVRLLSFFTWLRGAEGDGMRLPDLDALLALELPAQPTPRRFPQLLAYNVLPPSGGSGPLRVFNRTSVGEALDLLQPRSGSPFPAARRFERALAALDRRQADHAGLAQELEKYDPRTLDGSALDLLAYRAERLRMHQLVLNTLPTAERDEVQRRKQESEGLRTLSVGIGGLDLGMRQALARASGRNERMQLGSTAGEGKGAEQGAGQGSGQQGEQGGHEAGAAQNPGAGDTSAEGGRQGPASTGRGNAEMEGRPPGGAWQDRDGRSGSAGMGVQALAGLGVGAPHPREDPAVLPPILLPEHGLAVSGGGGKAVEFREYRAHWIHSIAAREGGAPVTLIETVMGSDGPDPRVRRLVLDAKGSASRIERFEDGRLLRYRLDHDGARLIARPVDDGLPAALAASAADPRGLLAKIPEAGATAPGGELPPGLTLFEALRAQAAGEAARGSGAGAAGTAAGGTAAGGTAAGGTVAARAAGTAAAGAVGTAAGGAAGQDGKDAPGRAAQSPQAPAVRFRLRAAGGRNLEASIPRPILQRLVQGREMDLTPEKPLPGLTPAAKVLGDAQALMVMMDRDGIFPPWSGSSEPVAGEEDAGRLAFALQRWWRAEAGAQPTPVTVVGTDPLRSPQRWRAAASAGRRSVLLLPEDAYPGSSKEIRPKLAEAWKDGMVISSPSGLSGALVGSAGTAGGAAEAAAGFDLVILVSAEDPGLLGARLREIARNPAMKGKRLAVWPLGGPVRSDLAASLLAEGNLAALGLVDYTPIESGRASAELADYRAALSDPASQRERIEALPSPLLWFY